VKVKVSPFLYAASSLYEYRRHAFYCWDSV
jgi:hypothetical protein